MTICLNCDNNFEGLFCNLCGQKAATHRFTMHEWLHEIPHSILHVDSGFFLTMKTLFIRPGDAIREFLRGKRKLLFSPFLYVLVLCGIFVVVKSFFVKELKPIDFTDAAKLIETISEQYYKLFVIASIIPLTIASYLVYFKSKYNFAEHLVLNSYLIAQLVIADVIIIFISTTSLDENYRTAYQFMEFAIKYPYWFWMFWQFFKPAKWYWGILQFILFILLSAIVSAIVLVAPIAIYLLKIKGSN
jgi:Protein of unknown function (DUF3667)